MLSAPAFLSPHRCDGAASLSLSPPSSLLSIIRAFHAANLAMQANVWFNYVASKANVADLPSRGDLDLMAEVLLQASPSFSLSDDVVDLVLPACPRDLQGLWAAVMAQLRPGSGGPERHAVAWAMAPEPPRPLAPQKSFTPCQRQKKGQSVCQR